MKTPLQSFACFLMWIKRCQLSDVNSLHLFITSLTLYYQIIYLRTSLKYDAIIHYILGHGILIWHSILYHDIPHLTVMFCSIRHSILWNSFLYYDIPIFTMTFHSILRHSTPYYNVPSIWHCFNTMSCLSMLWHSIRCTVKLSIKLNRTNIRLWNCIKCLYMPYTHRHSQCLIKIGSLV